MKYNTGADPGDFKGFHALFASDRPITSLYKLVFKKSYLGKLKSVYYHTITYHKSYNNFHFFYFRNYIILY